MDPIKWLHMGHINMWNAFSFWHWCINTRQINALVDRVSIIPWCDIIESIGAQWDLYWRRNNSLHISFSSIKALFCCFLVQATHLRPIIHLSQRTCRFRFWVFTFIMKASVSFFWLWAPELWQCWRHSCIHSSGIPPVLFNSRWWDSQQLHRCRSITHSQLRADSNSTANIYKQTGAYKSKTDMFTLHSCMPFALCIQLGFTLTHFLSLSMSPLCLCRVLACGQITELEIAGDLFGFSESFR